MQPSRRNLLAIPAAAVATGLAGCNALGGTDTDTPTETASETSTPHKDTPSEDADESTETIASVNAVVAEELFERFEQNKLDVHETVESTSEELHTQFKKEHLGSLIDAFENTNDSRVNTHYEGVQSTYIPHEPAGIVGTVIV